MFITTQNEIINLMPTARWDRPEQLFGYLEEEERVALEPLLGTELYMHMCEEYERLREKYVDITSTTIKPTHKAKPDPVVPYADVTERLDAIQAQEHLHMGPCVLPEADFDEVTEEDMLSIRLLRICQQIEFYKMLSHKAGLLTVSFNEGGGMNMVSADGYDPADEKRMERVVKDAFMSAGRAVDSLLLFLEADAKGKRQFTDLWSKADAYYLHKDLLFQTARVLNEYLDIKNERMAYVELVRDIRFCQNTYIKPRIGKTLLQAVVEFANNGNGNVNDNGNGNDNVNDNGNVNDNDNGNDNHEPLTLNPEPESQTSDISHQTSAIYEELLSLLRTALAFYVESRRVTLGPKEEKLARRDSMTDAQQAMAEACAFIEENLEELGEAAVDSPIYNKVKEQEELAKKDAIFREAVACRQRKAAMMQNRKKLFTAFPFTHRNPEYN